MKMFRIAAIQARLGVGLIGLVLLATASCRHDTTQVPDTNVPCEPGVVYFKNEILPIFQGNCAYAGCHGQGSAKDFVKLDDYASIIRSGIKPGKPDGSKIYEAIIETNPDDVMPPPPAKLTAAQIDLIRRWIEQGALNNGCKSCDTLTVTFSGNVKPMIDNACGSCHNPSQRLDLATWQAVKTAAESGKLMGALEHRPGFLPMPQGTPKWSDCELGKVRTWIRDGMPNN